MAMVTSASGRLLSALGDYFGSGAGAADDEQLALDTAAHGEPEQHPAWPRFYSVWGGDGATRDNAERKWRESMRWREAHAMDEALLRPQPYFHLVKRTYAHCFHKHCRDGRVLVLERGDQFAALVAAFEAAELDPSAAALHVATLNEFLGSRLDPAPYPRGRCVRVFDCEQLSAWDLGTSAVAFARAVASVLGPNYPERISRVFVVNAPPSFAMAYSLMSPLLTRRLLDKVSLFSATQAKEAAAALLELVPPENLPVRYGGTCACAGEGGCWRNAPDEQALWRLVEETTPPEMRR